MLARAKRRAPTAWGPSVGWAKFFLNCSQSLFQVSDNIFGVFNAH